MRSWKSWIAIITVGIAVTGCSSSQQTTGEKTAKEIKIGLLAPLNAGDATGRQMKQGAQLAADIINSGNTKNATSFTTTGGLPKLDHAKIQIVPANTEDKTDVGVKQTTHLATIDHVSAIVAGNNTDLVAAASLTADRLEIPFIATDPSANFLTERGLQWYFRLGPTDRSYGENFFSILKQQKGLGKNVSRIGIIASSDETGAALAQLTKQLADEAGYVIVRDAAFSANGDGINTAVNSVKSRNPDVVFVYSPSATEKQLSNAFTEQKYTPNAIFSYGNSFSDPTTLPTELSTICRHASWNSTYADRNSRAKAISDLYEKKYSQKMTEVAANAYTAVITAAEGINAGGADKAAKIRSGLINLNLPGRSLIMPWDGIKFDSTLQNSETNSTIEQNIDNSFSPIYPAELSTKKIIWQ